MHWTLWFWLLLLLVVDASFVGGVSVQLVRDGHSSRVRVFIAVIVDVLVVGVVVVVVIVVVVVVAFVCRLSSCDADLAKTPFCWLSSVCSVARICNCRACVKIHAENNQTYAWKKYIQTCRRLHQPQPLSLCTYPPSWIMYSTHDEHNKLVLRETTRTHTQLNLNNRTHMWNHQTITPKYVKLIIYAISMKCEFGIFVLLVRVLCAWSVKCGGVIFMQKTRVFEFIHCSNTPRQPNKMCSHIDRQHTDWQSNRSSAHVWQTICYKWKPRATSAPKKTVARSRNKRTWWVLLNWSAHRKRERERETRSKHKENTK